MADPKIIESISDNFVELGDALEAKDLSGVVDLDQSSVLCEFFIGRNCFG